MNRILGIDISHHNALSDSHGFHELLSAGLDFIILKASQGSGYTDPTFADRIHRLNTLKGADGSYSILPFAYHFGDDSSGAGQADFFLSHFAGHGKIVPALDWETNVTPGGTTMKLKRAEDFVTRLHEKTAKWPVQYWSRSWPGDHGIKAGYDGPLIHCPVWMAAPRATMPSVPAPFKRVDIWQSSWTYRIGGMSGVDLDEFQGTEAQLRAFWEALSVG